MKRTTLLAAAAAITLALGPAAPARSGTVTDVLDQARQRIGPVLLARDVLAQPGDEIALEAGLRTGLRLTGIEGKRVQFLLGTQLLGEVLTPKGGDVALRWKVPAQPGDHAITVRLHPEDQPEKPIEDASLLVAARPPEAPLVVVDLDKTVVASGFAWVLVGGAQPMAGASVVLTRLAGDHTIVYLTHRPDFLGPRSKRWLADNAFPRGPVLTSTLGGFVAGSEAYKSGRLESIRLTYKNVTAGIGDKFSDARAYADKGLRSILILDVDWSEAKAEYFEKLADELAALPAPVQVVTNWSEISAILYNKVEFSKQAMERRLRDMARQLRSKPKP